jgi:hypothetical protein
VKCARLTNIFVCHLCVLSTLRLWAHDRATMMVFDERYVPLHRQANLLAIAKIVHHGMPVFNATSIMAMVDRRRSDTRSVHPPCGKMMVTLEDVGMILGLPIEGCPVTRRVDSAGWSERVTDVISRVPPLRVQGIKG